MILPSGHRWSARVGAAALLSVATSSVVAQTRPQLDSAFTVLAAAGEIVGMSAAVVQNGSLAWSRTYGRRHSQRDELVDGHTVFAAAGLTEPVVAYGVLRLADRGVVELDRPIAELLPNARMKHDPRSLRITPRMVLSHTTGLEDRGRDSVKFGFDPGTNWGQSTEAFIWLGDAIARKTRLPLSELLRREVFEPLGMRRSALVTTDSLESNGTMAHDEWARPQPLFRPAIGAFTAATGLRTTAEDYAKFVIAVMEGRGLRPESARQMFSVQAEARNAKDYAERPAEVRERISWGLGWGLERRDDGVFAWHWGDGGYDKSFVMLHPATRRAVVYLTNSQMGLSIMPAVVSLAFPGRDYMVPWLEYWPYDRPSVANYRAVVRAGREFGVTGAAREYLARRGQLTPESIRSAAVALGVLGASAAGDTVLALAERGYPDSVSLPIARGDLALVENADVAKASAHFAQAAHIAPNDTKALGRVRWIRETVDIPRKTVDVPTTRLASLVGTYGEVRTSLESGRLYYHDVGGRKYPLVALQDGTFAPDGLPVVRLRFAQDKTGRTTSLIRVFWDGDRFEDARTR